jgi:hydroxymethylbilane synthase
MAIEIDAGRTDLQAILAPLNHIATQAAVLAERAVSRTFGGSCQIPLAAFAEVDGNNMRLRAMVATPDGKRVAKAEVNGSTQDPEALGRQAVAALNAQDAVAILAACNTESVQAE